MNGDRSGEAGQLLVGEGVLHQAEEAVGGAGHALLLALALAARPLGVLEVGEVHLLETLKIVTPCCFFHNPSTSL